MAIKVDVFAEFQSRYKNRILGVYDNTYMRMAGAVKDDDTAKMLKQRRTNAQIEINRIKASGQDQGTIDKMVGQRQLMFLRTAITTLDNKRDDGNLRDMRYSINNMAKELKTAMDNYLKSDTRTAAEDANFKKNAEQLVRKLTGLSTSIKGQSAAAGVRFDIQMYQAGRTLDALRVTLSDFPPAGSYNPPADINDTGDDPSTVPVEATNPGGIDITV